MTTSLSAALRMPHRASVAALAPMAPGASAEPHAGNRAHARELGIGGIIAPACGGRLGGGSESSDRFGGITRPGIGGSWYGQDQAQLAGGGPLRG